MRNLFIVGAQRSGTSYLYKCLDIHPNIEMAKPSIPEPKFDRVLIILLLKFALSA